MRLTLWKLQLFGTAPLIPIAFLLPEATISFSIGIMIMIASFMGAAFFNWRAAIITARLIKKLGIEKEQAPFARFLFSHFPRYAKLTTPSLVLGFGAGMTGSVILNGTASLFVVALAFQLCLTLFMDYYHDRAIERREAGS